MASLIVGIGVAALYGSGGAAASATGWAAVGWAVAATAAQIGAAYIDQTYVYPLFKPDQEIRGPRLDDRPVQTASEGSPLHKCYGAENRIAGTVIWLSKLLEYSIRRDVGGGKAGGSDPVSTTYDYYYHVAVALCEGPIVRVNKIWADAKVLYDRSVSIHQDPQIHKLRFHLGGNFQAADPLIQAEQGAENTPAFRNTAYVVMEGLFLQNFGNRLPQFSFLVEVDEHRSVASLLSETCNRHGLTADQIVTDGVVKSVRGYTLTGPTAGLQAIEPVMQAYRVLAQETGDTIRFFNRGTETVIDVDSRDLVAKEGDKPSDFRPFMLQDPSGFILPREVNVRYVDPTSQYQSGLTRYARNDTRGIQTVQFDLPLVMSAKDARDFAAQWIWRSFSERMQIQLSLPPKYFRLQENDVLRFTWGSEEYALRISEANVGLNGLINVRGLLIDHTDADEDVDCGPATVEEDEDGISIPSAPMLFAMLDTQAVRDEDVDRGGVYYGIVAPFGQDYFNGASIYQSTDGVTWLLQGSVAVEATMGVSLSTLAVGEANYWDEVNTLDVQLYQGELESRSEDEVLNGANRMWVGEELLAYKTATLIGQLKYRLSGLLRRLRTTPAEDHQPNERVLLLNPDSVFFQPINASTIGSTRYFKVIQPGEELEDVQAFSFVFEGNTLKQLAPYAPVVSRHPTTFDVTLTWTRRTRALVKAFAPIKPLNFEYEQYVVEWWSVNGSLLADTLKRTVIVNAASTTTYTLAERLADDFSAFSRVIARIYQMGPTGRGFPAEILLP